MANIVIASNDPNCQSAKEWFKAHQKFEEGTIDKLANGDALLIIAHDTELGDASAFVQHFPAPKDPSIKFTITLIVCGAAGTTFLKDLKTPAEWIANHFKQPVQAADSVVYGVWGDKGATFTGKYTTVMPDSDITSALGKMSIK
jgi:hypothetical protein